MNIRISQYLVCFPFAFMTACIPASMDSTCLLNDPQYSIWTFASVEVIRLKEIGPLVLIVAVRNPLRAEHCSLQCCGSYVCVFICLLCSRYHLCFVMSCLHPIPSLIVALVSGLMTCFQFTSWFMYEFKPLCIMYPALSRLSVLLHYIVLLSHDFVHVDVICRLCLATLNKLPYLHLRPH